MTAMSISLSEKLRGFVKSRVSSGDYHNESEYIRDLIRKDREKLADEQALLAQLQYSENSGVSEDTVLSLMKNVKESLN